MKKLKLSPTISSRDRLEEIRAKLIDIAERIDDINPIFVPCFADTKEGSNKKLPCKGVRIDQKRYSANELIDFPSMETLGLFLGDDYIVIDCDGELAVNQIEELEKGLDSLPTTLVVSSNPGVREAYFFKIPEKWRGVLKSFDRDKFELQIRTGIKYQIVGGKHPSNKNYVSNYHKIVPLPEKWCDYFDVCAKNEEKLESSVTEKNPNDSKLNTLVLTLDLLEGLGSETINVDSYDSWLKVGMIFHHISDDEICYQHWLEWSKKSEKFDEKVCESKWKSFGDKRNSITVGSLIYWLKKESGELKGFQKTTYDSAIKTLSSVFNERWKLEDRKKIIDEFKTLQLKGEDLTVAIQRLAIDIYGNVTQQQLLWDLYYSTEVTEDLAYAYQLSIHQQLSVDISEQCSSILDCPIFDTIKHNAIQQGLGQFIYHGLNAFITISASILPKGLSYNFNQSSKTVPIIFTIFVGVPSAGKDAIMKPLFQVLADRTKIIKNDNIARIKGVEKEKRLFLRETPKKEQENIFTSFLFQNNLPSTTLFTPGRAAEMMFPDPIKNPPYVMFQFTPAKGRAISGEFKTRGILVCESELKGLLNMQARSGASNGANGGSPEIEEFLTAYDGAETFTDLIGDDTREVDKYQLSLLSGIQPIVFDETFSLNDPNGFLSRCSLVELKELVTFKLNENPDKPDAENISPFLDEFYTRLEHTFKDISWENQLVIKPTIEAKALWNEFSNYCSDKSNLFYGGGQESGFFAWLRRHHVRVARYALIIHAIYCAEGIEKDRTRLSYRSMQDAVNLGFIQIRETAGFYKVSLNEKVDQNSVHSGKLKAFSAITKLLVKKNQISVEAITGQKWASDLGIVGAFFPNQNIRRLGVKEVIKIFEEMHQLGLAKLEGRILKYKKIELPKEEETLTSFQIGIKNLKKSLSELELTEK